MTLALCIYCGGPAGINVVERPTGPLHYSRISCAEFLLAERARLNRQIEDLKKKPTAVLMPPSAPLMSFEIREIIDRLQEEKGQLQVRINAQREELMEKVTRAHRAANDAYAKLEQSNRLIGELRESLAEMIQAVNGYDHDDKYREELEDAEKLLRQTEKRVVPVPNEKQKYCDHAWAGENDDTACKYCGMLFYERPQL